MLLHISLIFVHGKLRSNSIQPSPLKIHQMRILNHHKRRIATLFVCTFMLGAGPSVAQTSFNRPIALIAETSKTEPGKKITKLK